MRSRTRLRQSHRNRFLGVGKSITTEAITGVNVALMSIYDMMKEVDQSMMMTRIHLESESGGERGPFVFDDAYENIDF